MPADAEKQAPPRLRLLQRSECGLCEEMLSALTRLARERALPPLELIDVDSDALLKRRHGLHVPVLLLDDTVVCRHRLDRAELERLLRTPPGGAAPVDGSANA